MVIPEDAGDFVVAHAECKSAEEDAADLKIPPDNVIRSLDSARLERNPHRLSCAGRVVPTASMSGSSHRLFGRKGAPPSFKSESRFRLASLSRTRNFATFDRQPPPPLASALAHILSH